MIMMKHDRINESSVSIVNEIVSKAKKPIPMVEVSALKGITYVDLCFLVMAHLVDTRKPHSKMVPYAKLKSLLDNKIYNEESFQAPISNDAHKMLKSHVEFKFLTELCGTEHVNHLILIELS